MGSKPRFEHDCSKCIFLGQTTDADLWYCPGNTLIARHGSEGDYFSGFPFVWTNKEMKLAYQMAKELGLWLHKDELTVQEYKK